MKKYSLDLYLSEDDAALVEKIREYRRSKGDGGGTDEALVWLLGMGMATAEKFFEDVDFSA